MATHDTFPATDAIRRLLKRAFPGASEAIVEMRERILEFATSPLAKVLFLAGPSGVGKSTVARHVAYVKPYAILDADHVDGVLEHIRYVGPNLIEPRLMEEWYVELALTGLAPTLAESQLFGVAKGAFTGATPRHGVFERARQSERKEEVRVTGGVVFLDEVGELTDDLQAKLLPILSNGVFYRVGGEGDPSHRGEYHGILITASWRDIHATLRPDLVARLTTHVIEVPSLQERTEDLPDIVAGLAHSAVARFHKEIDRLRAVTDAAGPQLETVRNSPRQLDNRAIEELCAVDWSLHGELRGLANAVEKIVLQQQTPQHVIATLPRIKSPPGAPSMADHVFAHAEQGRSLTDIVRTRETWSRVQLRDRILNEPGFRAQLARALNITEGQLRKQANSLARDRRSSTGSLPQGRNEQYGDNNE